jgi:hypothetical protein
MQHSATPAKGTVSWPRANHECRLESSSPRFTNIPLISLRQEPRPALRTPDALSTGQVVLSGRSAGYKMTFH